MNEQLKSDIQEYMAPLVTEIGFAPVDRFDQTPEAHHPSRICKDAQTVIVFGIVTQHSSGIRHQIQLAPLNIQHGARYSIIVVAVSIMI